MRATVEGTWVTVGPVEAVPAGSGVAALLPGGEQVAVFRLPGGEVHAVSNVDPLGNAAVLSRGIVGDTGGVPVVASPLLKERYDLRTGECLDADGVRIATYPVRVRGGVIQVRAAGSP